MRKVVPFAFALSLALVGCAAAPAEQQEAPAEEEEVVEQETTDEKAEIAEEPADEAVKIYWANAKTAEEAASGAGFAKFGVLSSIKVGDQEFKDPTFQYAGRVAQATYELPASAIYLRKAVGPYTTPLSDRTLDEFEASWHKNYEGIEVSCYGPAKGAVTVATWNDGTQTYCLTFQGLGGDEMSMDTDELATVIKGIHEANVDTTVTEKKAEEPKSDEKPNDTLLSARDAEAAVEKDSGADCKSIDLVSTKKYGDCWYAVCLADDGTRYEYYVDNDGAHLIKKEAPEKKQEEKKEATDGHYEGEPVTIFGSVYAQWHKANDGQWYAVFITYNNTQIFAQTTEAGGGWLFYALDNGQMVQVVYSEVESTAEGKTGPAGASSHWQELNGDRWY